MDAVHCTSTPVFATVYTWVNGFKRCRSLKKVEHSPGCPVEVSTPETINKIQDLILSSRRIKVRELVKATGLSQGTVVSSLHGKLSVIISAPFRRNLAEFLHRYVTIDETWIHYYTPETKRQSPQ